MSALAIFCCTTDGAYVTYETVGISTNSKYESNYHLSIAPNPVKGSAYINYELNEKCRNHLLYIYQSNGKLVNIISLDDSIGSLKINCFNYPAGIYYIIIEAKNYRMQKKLVML